MNNQNNKYHDDEGNYINLSKDELEAFTELSKEQMQAYNRQLSYFITHINAESENSIKTALMNNAAILNKYLPRLNDYFPKSSVDEFYIALQNLKLATYSCNDPTLKSLLQKNLDELKAFFTRAEPYLKDGMPHLHALMSELSTSDEDQQPPLHIRLVNPHYRLGKTQEFREIIKDIVTTKNNPKVETSEYMKIIADGLKASYGKDVKDASIEAIDQFMLEGIAKLKEHREWEKQWTQPQVDAKPNELSRYDRQKQLRDKLNAIADSFVAEVKKEKDNND